MSFLNLKKIKPKKKYHRFNQDFVQSGKLSNSIHYHFDQKFSFFTKGLYNGLFSVQRPVYNSKLCVRRRDPLGRLIWGMYGRDSTKKWSSLSFDLAVRVQYFSKCNRLISRSFVNRLFRRRKRFFKRKRIFGVYKNGFLVIAQLPRFLWNNEFLNPKRDNFSYYTQLSRFRLRRKRIKFRRKQTRRAWKFRLRKQKMKSKFRRRRRRDIYFFSFKVKFIDPRFLGRYAKKPQFWKKKKFSKKVKHEKKTKDLWRLT